MTLEQALLTEESSTFDRKSFRIEPKVLSEHTYLGSNDIFVTGYTNMQMENLTKLILSLASAEVFGSKEIRSVL